MLHRTHRFHGPNSLTYVHRRGQTVRGSYGALKFVRNDRIQTHRVAVVVSRKVSKLAVVRNRIRRRIYAVVQEFDDRISGPYDLVFMIYDETVATVPQSMLRRSIVNQLDKAGVLATAPDATAKNAIMDRKETK